MSQLSLTLPNRPRSTSLPGPTYKAKPWDKFAPDWQLPVSEWAPGAIVCGGECNGRAWSVRKVPIPSTETHNLYGFIAIVDDWAVIVAHTAWSGDFCNTKRIAHSACRGFYD